ncbi:MAG: transposase [Clostridia bacterium]|nr:transposase [Clostridia bacterium]
MGVVNRNLIDMPVPSFAYPDRNDGRVFVKPIEEDGKPHKRTIGHMTVSTPGQERMVPTFYFKEKYQDLYMEYYPNERIPYHQMSVGMYALTLGIVTKTKLYDDIKNVYGLVFVNNILDYAMFSILHRSSVTQIYENTMSREVLFSDSLHTDSWYSDFFSKKIDEDMHHQFRIAWIRRLIQNGLKKVWLCIDGSNDDCEARMSFLAQFGFPKSHNANKTIVGFMYVVDGDTGRPVTYFVYEGSVPDAPAFQKVAAFLKSFTLDIEGVILDRGFAVESVFKTIAENNWKYVIMLPSDTYGHTQMLKECGEKIRWKSEYILKDDTIFGILGRKKLFGIHERESNICLFFDGVSGSAQSVRLIKKIQSAKKKAERAIAGGSRVAIEKSLQKYLRIEGEGANRKVVANYDKWNTSMSEKGFHSIAVADNIMPNEANRLYKLRDTSETQYSILKSQEGANTTRVHKTEGIYSKFALSFISSLIRFEIEAACKKLEMDTNPTIQSMEQIALLYGADGRYEAVRNLSGEQKQLFEMFDMDQDDLERIAKEFNSRNQTDSKNPNRIIAIKTPVIQKNTHKRGRISNTSDNSIPEESTPVNTDTIKSKGGRPLGKKDSKPRNGRSDKGMKRGPHKK